MACGSFEREQRHADSNQLHRMAKRTPLCFPFFMPWSCSHDEFVVGFGDGSGVSEPAQRALAYARWVAESGLNEIELIDLETGGYLTGLEAGNLYRKEN